MTSMISKTMVGVLFATLILVGSPAAIQAEQHKDMVLTSDIIDQDVYDKEQNLIGEVDDLIIRRSGNVKKLTVEFGGFLDLGDKLVALPFGRFNLTDGKVVLDVPEAQLKKKSEYDYYAHGLRPGYYYIARPYPGPYPDPTYYYGPHTPKPPEREPWVYSPPRFLASVVMHRNLINEDNKDIGTVMDLLINTKEGKVTKIILSSMDILGKEVHVALPYEPIGFSDYGIVYDIQKENLKEYIYPYEK
ncbi:MAG: PRC-barrel domain-containing protein [Deltaproteobacteria bacterium]|nr:PRC-barrel domain-containing protein [Deltaproteobacteria bacterium]